MPGGLTCSEGKPTMSSRLIDRGWLRRVIEVSLSSGNHFVEYDGRGLGYEHVAVDGTVICAKSWLWFVPRFEFKLAGYPTVVEVRVWPWLALRSLSLRVGDQIVYAEGDAARGKMPSEWEEWA
jgi:hypothetical protein